VYLAWYPIKDRKPVAAFHKALAAESGWPELLLIELMVRGEDSPDRLNGCGLIVANPPYALKAQLELLLPELSRRLALGRGAHHRLERIAAQGRGGSQTEGPSLKRKARAGKKSAHASDR
jgi:23S rRNA (adenine2030-N6)-methyltransferase